MLNEPGFMPSQAGWIEVICGGMFSGKTEELIRRAGRAHIAGLDMDYLGRPFEPMPQLLAIAEYVTKLHAICAESGMMANFSQRIVENDSRILVSENEAYEPRARHCFRPRLTRDEAPPPPLLSTEKDLTKILIKTDLNGHITWINRYSCHCTDHTGIQPKPEGG